jgi:beta-lactamase superfamily II metal-dependent hydrolase
MWRLRGRAFRRPAMAEKSDGGRSETGVSALFMNVGKADAALFMLGDKRYLIDTGTKESAEAMLRALSYYQGDRLDGVMITHTDKDHVGGLKTLLKTMYCRRPLYAPKFSTWGEDEIRRQAGRQI